MVKMLTKKLPPMDPLEHGELKRLGDLLGACTDGTAMSLEELDGFFCGLVAGPEMVLPVEFYPVVFGGEMTEVLRFESAQEANELVGRMMRHCNAITRMLCSDETPRQILAYDNRGQVRGNEWAHGFIKATLMRPDGWKELIDHPELGQCMLPVFVLYWEHGPDPKLRPKEPISARERDGLIAGMAETALQAHQFFRGHRVAEAVQNGTLPKSCRNPC